MTKLRAPLTIEDAANRVIGAIGMDQAVKATGRNPDYLRSLTDPDKRYKLTVEDAIKLDIAHQADGHEGAPIYETYGTLFDIAHAERFSDNHRFAQLVADFIKEVGDAGRALVVASLPGAGASEDRDATRETAEAVEAANVLLSHLTRRSAQAQAPP